MTTTQPTRVVGTVAIVGVGLMGGSLGLALKQRGLAQNVIGIGRNPGSLDQAVRLGAIDHAVTDLAAGVGAADLIVLCSTIGHILETLPALIETAPHTATITDVGSTKSEIVRHAGGAPNFVGSHPMAGSERVGVDAARSDLYVGATWALTPSPTSRDSAVRLVQSVAEAVGARTLFLTPEQHDSIVAITSHLPHVMSSALMRQAALGAASLPEMRRMTAGSFADMTRVAAASPDIWRDICLSNRDAVLRALAQFQDELNLLKTAVEDSDAPKIEAFFAEGAAAKRAW